MVAITAAATAVTFILIRERQTVHLAHIASKYALTLFTL